MPDVEIQDRDAVRELRLTRPSRRNALTAEMYDALARGVTDAPETTRAILFLGDDQAFTAGNDLDDFQARPPADQSAPVFKFMRAVLDTPIPLVAGVTGVAAGIGTTLLLHCDLVTVGASARFIVPFVSLGLVPEFGSSRLLPAAMGRARANRHLLLGEPFDAATALACGIASEVVDDGEVAERARDAARRLAQQPPLALRRARALLRRDLADLDELIDRETADFVAGLKGPEFAAAAAAFAQRQKR